MENLIIKLFNESGMSIKEFATRADLKYSTAHDIVSGKANIENIGAGAFVRIAHVLNTTADALIGGQSPVDDDVELPDESELIALFRSMNARGREQLMVFARGCAASYPKNQASEMGA